MDGHPSSSDPIPRRSGVKRRYDDMASHSSPTRPDAQSRTFDSHYHNPEHPHNRPRTALPGFDVLVRGLQREDQSENSRTELQSNDIHSRRFLEQEPETIDLTRETLALPRHPQVSRPVQQTEEPPSRSSRLPRFSRSDIIDISSGDEDDDDDEIALARQGDTSQETQQSSSSSHSSNEISGTYSPGFLIDDGDLWLDGMDDSFFLDSMDVSPRPRPTTRRQQPRRAAATPAGANIVDLTDDDVEFIESRSLNNANAQEPTLASNVQTRGDDARTSFPFNAASLVSMFRATAGFSPMSSSRLAARLNAHYTGGSPNDSNPRSAATGGRTHHLPRRFNSGLAGAWSGLQDIIPAQVTNAMAQVPGLMDYHTVAFNLGGVTEPQRDRSPAYQAPPLAADGFTRNPAEDEIVVCPNCGDELAQGDSELKRQVWIVKACGHAYCGECVMAKLQHTSRGKGSRKDAALTLMTNGHPLLKKCVIDGCDKPVTKANVVHVYLSE